MTYRKVKTEIGELTVVVTKSKSDSRYIATFKEKPNLIAKGDTMADSIYNLQDVVDNFIAHEKRATKSF